VASTWAFEAQGPGSIPGGGAISEAQGNSGAISEAEPNGGAISEAKPNGGAVANPVKIDFTHGLTDRDRSCSG
jgi:uncharacterized membrane protein